VQGHQALLVFMSGVAPAESDLIIFKGGETMIRDCNSMRVTAEIAKGMLGPSKRPFAVDDPLLAKRLLYQLREYFWPAQWFQCAMKAKLTLSKDLLQGFGELAAKHFGEDIDRKKELWMR
jgi:hypothetical protein